MRLRRRGGRISRLRPRCFDGGPSELGSYAGGIFYGEIALSLQKIDVRCSLGNEMEDEG